MMIMSATVETLRGRYDRAGASACAKTLIASKGEMALGGPNSIICPAEYRMFKSK
jgi:hypothetical protein